jgi:hypothetical protein
MRSAAWVVTVMLAGGAAASCHRLIPASRPPFTVTGRVESIDAGGLSLRHKSGQRIRIAVVPETTVTRNGRSSAPAEIRVGMRVVVVYRFVDETAVADEVRLFRGPINYP